MHPGSAAVEVAVAVLFRRVAEISAGVIALLRRGRPPYLSIIAEIPAFMHELGEKPGETVRPVHAESVSVFAQRDQHGREIALVHFALSGIANMLSGYGAH